MLRNMLEPISQDGESKFKSRKN